MATERNYRNEYESTKGVTLKRKTEPHVTKLGERRYVTALSLRVIITTSIIKMGIQETVALVT